jgi:NAD(P)-dependent dehydrogenase (short-subunit alcohol dehydrogenase family)
MILITGASRGVGKFILDAFIKENKEQVMGTYLHSLPLEHTSNYVKLDVTDYEAIANFVSVNKDSLSDITLINCAGINYNSFTHKSEKDKWRNVIETNLMGTYNVIRNFLPLMRTEKFGRIINFSSVVAIKPTPGVSSYATSKSALWGLSKTIAIENAAFNITINNINLGYSEFGMIGDVPEEYLKEIIAQIPVGRLCNGSEILNTIQYLQNTGYITGNSIDLSGGLV